MSREENCELHARLVTKTELAVLLTDAKTEDEARYSTSAHTFWLPRTHCGRTSTIPVPNELPIFRCQVPEWKIVQDNLWKYVKS